LLRSKSAHPDSVRRFHEDAPQFPDRLQKP
jgi:hypothetical protein